ncbi:MAG: hypothetical protein U0164_13185 [Gemmatimonadaceae bacterium]
MLRCEEVAHLIGSDELEQAPLARRVALRMHLAMCKQCQAYADSLKEIARTARRLAQRDDDTLSAQDEAVLDAFAQRVRSGDGKPVE